MKLDFISRIAPLAMDEMRRSGILASLIIAQAALESAWGTSGLTKQANNLFGMKGIGPAGSITLPTKEWDSERGWYTINASFRKYGTWRQSIEDHTNLFLRLPRYANLIGETDYKAAAKKVHADGYATDPDYPAKLVGIIEEYLLHQYDQMVMKEREKMQEVTVIVDGEKLKTKGILIEGTSNLPSRELAEKLGYAVGWNRNTNTVTLEKEMN
jgi:flagellum-specific peptidoglycan hydrolase FlgJ